MIDYIKYTIDNKTYDLINNGNGTWSKDLIAPSALGRYDISFEISENSIVTFIDSSDPRYELTLEILISAERNIYLQELVPDHVSSILEITALYDAENIEMDKLYAAVEKIKSDAYISTASNDAISRREKFIGIKPEGTLEQRKNYLRSLNTRGNKLNETTIRSIANAISGSDCTISFFSASEVSNPEPGQGLLRVQILSPDGREYRYEDIERALKPLVPAHLKLIVIKYFSLWKDVRENFADWNAVKSFSNWGKLKNYIPPM